MRLAAVGSNCIDYYNNIDGEKHFRGRPGKYGSLYTPFRGEAAYIGPVGDDVYGQIMIETIKAKGVDTSRICV